MKVLTRNALAALLALGSFALVCISVTKFFPIEVPVVSEKLRLLTRRKDDYDVLFIGTSRVFHGIAPASFDRTAKSLGYSCRSFNAAADDMGTEESMALIEKFAALRPQHWRYLFLELADVLSLTATPDEKSLTERDIYWRNWNSLVWAGRIFIDGLREHGAALVGPPLSLMRLEEVWPLFSTDIGLWARNQTNFGRGVERIQAFVSSRPSARSQRSAWDGFYEMSLPMNAKMQAAYRKQLAEFQGEREATEIDPRPREEIARFAQELAQQGVKVVYLVPPSFSAHSFGAKAPEKELLFDYADTTRYRDLYAEANHLDPQHLNGRGAGIFSATLARDFVQRLHPFTR